MRRTLPVSALAFPLILAGCSASEQEVVYVTETSWVNAEPSPIDDASPAPTKSDAPAAEPSDAPEPPTPAGFALDPAYKGKVGGSCGTTPEGFRIRVGTSTSCDFASVVWGQARDATYTLMQRDPTVNASYTAFLTGVPSPVTGEQYDLRCSIGSDGTHLSCMGEGNNPLVSFEDPGRGWRTRLNIV